MKTEREILEYYRTDRYFDKNSVNFSDAIGPGEQWKIDISIPKVSHAVRLIGKDKITLLDVGGGTGLCLKAISNYMRENLSVEVAKYSLDLSPRFAQIQRHNNPDIIDVVNEDVRCTSFADKKFDVSLMLDVLEHVPTPERALRELGRISKYTVFKQPLEDNVLLNTFNLLTFNKQKKHGYNTTGHINFYSASSFKKQIQSNGGSIVDLTYPNGFEHLDDVGFYRGKSPLKKLINDSAKVTFKISPKLATKIFNNYLVALVKWS